MKFDAKTVREIIALIYKEERGWTPGSATRMQELLGASSGTLVAATQFSDVVCFAVDEGSGELREVAASEDLYYSPKEFERFVEANPGVHCEMWGRHWPWSEGGAGISCITMSSNATRPDGIRAVAEQAFRVAAGEEPAPGGAVPTP